MFPIRAVVDYDVDRQGVEARQRVKLTCTNSSIGLIALIIRDHRRLRLSSGEACLRFGLASPQEREDGTGPVPDHDQFHEPVRRLLARTGRMRLAGPVIFAERLHPIPSRTRK